MNDIHKEFYIKYLQPADKEDWLANIILLKVPPKVLVILKHHRLMLLQAPLSWRWKPFSERKNEQCRFYNSFIKLPQTKPKWNKRWKNRATSPVNLLCLKSKISDNLQTNTEDQTGEDAYYYYWLTLNLSGEENT